MDQLGDGAEAEYQEKNLQIKGEVDRIYQSMSSVLVRDLDRHRSVFVDKAGSRSTVIWKSIKPIIQLRRNTLVADSGCVGTRDWFASSTVSGNKSLYIASANRGVFAPTLLTSRERKSPPLNVAPTR